MATINDVAKLAGVAKSTVSNVLTDKRFVSPEIKKKVLKACKELNFRPNFYASTLSSKAKSYIISLLLEQSANIDSSPIYQRLIKSTLKEASKYGYSLLIYYNLNDDFLQDILHQGRAPIDGAIIMAPSLNDVRIDEMKTNRTPSIIIGRPNSVHSSYIDIDNINLIRNVCDKLFKSYSDVCFINSPSNLTISSDRKSAFIEECNKFNINYDGKIFESPNKIEDGYEIAKKFAKKNLLFITTSGHVTQGVYQAIKEKGLKIGPDVGVFALGSSISSSEFNPRLSLASQDYDTIGINAVDCIMEIIKNPDTIHKILIQSDITYSDSTNRK